jgi:hypothetical protein
MLQGSFRNWDGSSDSAPSVRIDNPSSSVTYVGEAGDAAVENSSVWRIKKIVCVSDTLTVTWADGNTNFDNNWTNRASLSYS